MCAKPINQIIVRVGAESKYLDLHFSTSFVKYIILKDMYLHSNTYINYILSTFPGTFQTFVSYVPLM